MDIMRFRIDLDGAHFAARERLKREISWKSKVDC